jgi:hypothetical protein
VVVEREEKERGRREGERGKDVLSMSRMGRP